MPVVEHLVTSRPAFELHDEDGLHLGTIARDRPRVYAVDGHILGEEVKLVHGPGTVDRDVALKLTIHGPSFFPPPPRVQLA